MPKLRESKMNLKPQRQHFQRFIVKRCRFFVVVTGNEINKRNQQFRTNCMD